MRGKTFHGVFALGAGLFAVASAQAAIVTSVTASNGDAAITNTGGRIVQVENEIGGSIVPFGEDAFAYLDRTHQFNGPRFNTSGALTTTVTATDTILGVPSYLVGGEYVSTNNTHRDNATFQMDVTVGPAVTAYLLVDNRIGSGTANSTNDPPTLTTVMNWVLTDGWVQKNSGISPGGNPDTVGMDEGATITDFATRSTNTTNLATGAGQSVNSYFTVYEKSFPVGSTITLREQNDGGSRNMYGLVLTEVPEPSVIGVMAVAAFAGLGGRRRRA
jgi:hypothetical protein